MQRKQLLGLLSAYPITFPEDEELLSQTHQFVMDNCRCFERSLAAGHITGSAWIVDADKSHALFTHHKKLNRWLQLGGHADGMSDILNVALKEAREESGLSSIVPLSNQIFDIDIHLVPDHASGHYHYDIRFLFKADRFETYTVSDESHDLAWVQLDTIENFIHERSVLRMNSKMKRQHLT